jgi:hypothetical protein
MIDPDFDADSPDQIYQAGLLDALDDRPSLAHVLAIMGEHELLIAYGRGRVMGQRLMHDAELEI